MKPDPDRKPTEKESRGGVLPVVIVGTSLGDLSGILGLEPQFTPPPAPTAVIQFEAWPWAEPLATILRMGGWTHEEVVYDRQIAEHFGLFWRTWQESRRMAAERERRHRVEEARWWRAEGHAVPCPECGEIDDCACAGEEDLRRSG